MQTSVYLPDEVAQRLENFVGRVNHSRNKVIVEAIEEYLDKQEQKREWSPEIQLWFSQPEVKEELDLHREDHDWGDFTFEE
ncbi:MAG: ribbon-helix-helix protein, CopG family [Cyanobacteria bacterium J06638_38]